MPKTWFLNPRVCKDGGEKYYIGFNLNNKRYRLFGSKIISSSLKLSLTYFKVLKIPELTEEDMPQV